MPEAEIGTIVRRIDEDIAANRSRLKREVARYMQDNMPELQKQISETGQIRVPTFIGDVVFTQDDLLRAQQAAQPAEGRQFSAA